MDILTHSPVARQSGSAAHKNGFTMPDALLSPGARQPLTDGYGRVSRS
jgi:hypothetical protein